MEEFNAKKNAEQGHSELNNSGIDNSFLSIAV